MDEELKSYIEETKDAYDRVEELLSFLSDNLANEENLNALFRDFHSIKGVSGFFSFTTTEAICHAAEDAMSHFSSNKLPLNKDVIQVLYEVLDTLREVLRAIAETGNEPETDYSELLLKLSSMEMGGNPSPEEKTETAIVETQVELKESGSDTEDSHQKTGLFQLLYLSMSKWEFDTKELINLLCEARDHNRKDGLTGMLIYRDMFFMQTLEGPREKVISCFERIKKDPRHHNVVILGQGDIDERTFPDWSMGFEYMNILKRMNIDGLNETVTEQKWPEKIGEGLGFAYPLMRSFSENTDIL